IGEVFGLRGVWGADFVCQGEELLLVDINPRLTASGDIYERSLQVDSLVALHLQACRATGLAPDNQQLVGDEAPHLGPAVGKAVVYSPFNRPLLIDPAVHELLTHDDRSGPARLADIPHPGTRIRPHGPICTLYETVSDNHLHLRRTAKGFAASEAIIDLRRLLKQRTSQLLEQIAPAIHTSRR
ncbi:MAG: ATP-grasp domain-containing protein, partial [Mariniblastus sp.]|nr:ATP-grasp domain-containing protein [Mariniblastus sp.]